MYVKILKKVAGIILIIIGIIGLFLPFIPGIILIILGFMLMGIKKDQIKAWIKKLEF